MKLTQQIKSLFENSMEDEFLSKLLDQLKKEPDVLTWSLKPLPASKESGKINVPSFENKDSLIIPNINDILIEIYQDRYDEKPSNVSSIAKKLTSLIKNKNISFELADGNRMVGRGIVTVKNAMLKNGNLIIDKYEV